MFVGHFALGFAAKRAAPRTSLATLFAAAQLADLAWPVLLAAGLEQVRIEPGNTPFTPLDFVSYPYSHSLLTLVLAGVLFAAVYRAATGRNGRMMALLAGLVVSHWALDWVTHRPDLPLYPGGPRVGLGLWNHVGWTIAIELIMFAAGLWVYARATRPCDGIGRWAFLALWYASSIVSPPPPTVANLIAVAMIGSVVIVVLAWWSDSHRAPNDGAW